MGTSLTFRKYDVSVPVYTCVGSHKCLCGCACVCFGRCCLVCVCVYVCVIVLACAIMLACAIGNLAVFVMFVYDQDCSEFGIGVHVFV